LDGISRNKVRFFHPGKSDLLDPFSK
jgi:hypothetical protein